MYAVTRNLQYDQSAHSANMQTGRIAMMIASDEYKPMQLEAISMAHHSQPELMIRSNSQTAPDSSTKGQNKDSQMQAAQQQRIMQTKWGPAMSTVQRTYSQD